MDRLTQEELDNKIAELNMLLSTQKSQGENLVLPNKLPGRGGRILRASVEGDRATSAILTPEYRQAIVTPVEQVKKVTQAKSNTVVKPITVIPEVTKQEVPVQTPQQTKLTVNTQLPVYNQFTNPTPANTFRSNLFNVTNGSLSNTNNRVRPMYEVNKFLYDNIARNIIPGMGLSYDSIYGKRPTYLDAVKNLFR